MELPVSRGRFPWIFVWIIAVSSGTKNEFEAAFQGQCQDTTAPCEQLCINHSPRTFECTCRDGYRLDHNGYSCTDISDYSNITASDERSSVERSNEILLPTPVRSAKLADPPASPCATIVCVGGGMCAADRVHGYRCLCPLGRKGKHCEEHVTFVQPRFNGDSYAVLPLPTDWDYQFNLHIELRANTENGLVFYSGEDLAASKNFVSVELLEGYVVFRIRLNGRKIGIQSRYKVPLGDDVKLHVGRSGSTVFVQVAGEARIGTTVQEFADERLKATENTYLGSLPDLENLPSGILSSETGFVGCILRLEINGRSYSLEPLPFGSILSGINLDRCGGDACEGTECLNDGVCLLDHAKKPKCDCIVPYVGVRCEIDLDTEMPLFNGSSYLVYEMVNASLAHSTEFLVTFKPDDTQKGVLLHTGRQKNSAFSDSMQLRLSKGHAVLAVDLGEGFFTLRSQQALQSGLWYQIMVTRSGRYLEMVVEGQNTTEIVYNGAFSELTVARNILYVGGIDYNDIDESLPSFRGCVDLYKTEFMGVKLKLSKALAGVNLDTCRSS